ncbi:MULTISPECIES: methionine biosynthesis protein MetW [Nitrosomonas]|jgi:methionine biosynthesis protein MetW|uniref:Methionine biosynthesis protein MetW n=1 Tax=Nitrosomonas communis TaxID=44574 RepID=A0A0F7KH84_9PROT|nr:MULTISPECIES: methionine biosynthesis protein MetW [Nitrosomonas]AKH38207.1 methionine biosynthesis protein MetW [Nitrosomonas communis]TYP77428.1 methionine biosynthesis protein MetW [Nitrosomonas communis]UVS60178.1 methionine biosynthesis protein MetW [Nitrosomonas sp. PLL12]SDW30847.1 methionine biosynthesis protein MetW [Nitrosomonas communis]
MAKLFSSLTLSRPDFATIAAWIRPESRVLDLGCGDGTLLQYLQETLGVHGYGVEIDDANILACLNNGVNVVQSDLESGLSGFESDSFDYVILSQTLQAMRHTEKIIQEMLRAGKEGIVTFPNFGHWKNRLQVSLGHMPVSQNLPYEWFDTPNVHLCTLSDFEQFCHQHGVHILERRVMSGNRQINLAPNFFGMLAFYRFTRR